MKGENGKNNRETKSYTAEKTAFNQFNPITIEEIKKDIANKKGIRKEDIDLSKFVHMRTILSIPSHKEIVEQEMGTFLHKKYPKITMDSVKTIFNTMIDLLTRRQQMVRCSVSEKKRCWMWQEGWERWKDKTYIYNLEESI